MEVGGGMKQEPASPVRPNATAPSSFVMDVEARRRPSSFLGIAQAHRPNRSVLEVQTCIKDEESPLGKRKRIFPPTPMDSKPRISPKTSLTNLESTVQVKILEQPPRVWYRDQKGRRTIFSMAVAIAEPAGHGERLLTLDRTSGYFTTTLLYENGFVHMSQSLISLTHLFRTEVADKRIVELRSGTFYDPNTTSVNMEVRITDISKNHQNQKFRVRVNYVCPNMTVASAVSEPIHVLSKHVKKSLPTEIHLMKSIDVSASSASSEDIATPVQTPPIDSSPVEPTSASSSSSGGPPFKLANHMSMSRWCTTALNVLKHVEWAPGERKVEFKCPMCQTVTRDRATAAHDESCLLKMLLDMISTSPFLSLQSNRRSRGPVIPAPPVADAAHDQLRDPPATHDGAALQAHAATRLEPRADETRDFSLLSIGDISAFNAKTSTTLDDALMLKNLSQVSVTDADYAPFTSSQMDRLYPTPPPPESMHMLSRFTETTISASKMEIAVSAIALAPLEAATGHPAFDDRWNLIGLYHVSPHRDALRFVPVPETEVEHIWDNHEELEKTVLGLQTGMLRRRKGQFAAVGDDGCPTLERLKSFVLEAKAAFG
ncbi:Aste57867_452 [Aphanomyces stellatus]|uniref:Aste57867_452 protein n=1 Tax=Aphanomyces stellatus TaxID=120398 RepID=A0A485K3V0_9STRA|nr:hypothetical protein As57867_000451 [Aphanomyces stellatus]VFT77677.1 Aste57867_452 [Aphanomyces stellatus]